MAFPIALPIIGAALGAVANKRDPLKGAALGALGGIGGGMAMPALTGAAGAAGAAGATGATGALGSAMPGAGGLLGMSPSAGLATSATGAAMPGSGGLLGLSPSAGLGAESAASGSWWNKAEPFVKAAATGIQAGQGEPEQEQPITPSPFVAPQGAGPQTLTQLTQNIQQDYANRFPQLPRRY